MVAGAWTPTSIVPRGSTTKGTLDNGTSVNAIARATLPALSARGRREVALLVRP